MTAWCEISVYVRCVHPQAPTSRVVRFQIRCPLPRQLVMWARLTRQKARMPQTCDLSQAKPGSWLYAKPLREHRVTVFAR
jgi:hypothetical protein